MAPHGLLVARTERREKVVGEGIRPLASPGWPRCPGTAADCEIGKILDASGVSPGGAGLWGPAGFPTRSGVPVATFRGLFGGEHREQLCAAKTARNPPSSPTTSSLSFLPFLLKTPEKWLSVFFSFERY